MGRIINDEYFSDAEIIVKLQAELAQLKSESGFGTLLAENRATIEQQAEQIAALKKRENYIDALSNTIVDRDATIQQQAEQIKKYSEVEKDFWKRIGELELELENKRLKAIKPCAFPDCDCGIGYEAAPPQKGESDEMEKASSR